MTGKSICPVQTFFSFFRREEMLEFMHMCHRVVEMIMECFARGLGLQENFFKHVSISCCSFAHSFLGSPLQLCSRTSQALVNLSLP